MNCNRCGIPYEEHTCYWSACVGCNGHSSIHKTLVESPEWRKWYKYASENHLYDVDETMELGIMSEGHWKDFLKFVKECG